MSDRDYRAEWEEQQALRAGDFNQEEEDFSNYGPYNPYIDTKAERTMSTYDKMFETEMRQFRAIMSNETARAVVLSDAFLTAFSAIENHDFGTDTEAARRTPIQFEAKYSALTDPEQKYGYALLTARTYGKR